MGAIIAHDRVLEPIVASGEPFWSGQTYSCIPLAAAVGDAVLAYIQEHELVARSAEMGAYLKDRLSDLLETPHVGDVRGRGMFLGVEFVADENTKAPFAPELRFGKRVEAAALERGVVMYAGRGTVELERGDHMLFAPPLVLRREQADQIADVLGTSIEAAVAEL